MIIKNKSGLAQSNFHKIRLSVKNGKKMQKIVKIWRVENMAFK